jgi:hypothetical protein
MQNERQDRGPPTGNDVAKRLLPPGNGKHRREMTTEIVW